MSRVVVQVPATIANLGPGFDALGCAIAWHNQITLERADALEITAAGLGAEGVGRDATNLVARALAAVSGEDPPRVRIHQLIAIAFGRGFGSSAAAIVGGLVGGRALYGTSHSDDDLLRLAIGLEGHGDNVAPCLLGGITVVAGERVARLDPPTGMRPLLCVSPNRMPTETARAALPDAVPRADAVASLARAALLAASLATGRTDTLLEATDDVLHQPARFALIPDTADLVRALRARGIAAFLSGAGPSVAALVPEDGAGAAETDARRLAPEGWDVRLESFDARGAQVVSSRA